MIGKEHDIYGKYYLNLDEICLKKFYEDLQMYTINQSHMDNNE